jgi:LysM repeat protein
MRQHRIVAIGIIFAFAISGLFAPHLYSSAAQTTYYYHYSVQAGDYLYLLGQRFQVPWQSIASQNGISSPYTLYVGESLTIPLSSTYVTYTVQAGDYLGLIGHKYEVPWQTIASANGIYSPYVIYPSEKLAIPLVSASCSYKSTGGPDGSGWWCWTANISALKNSGLGADLSGVSAYFGVCEASLEQDNGYASNALVWTGEVLAIPNGSGCPREAWIWLWGNSAQYSQGLAEIQSHPGALTTVSPNTYYLTSSGTLALYQDGEICPQVHALGLKCDPLIGASGDALTVLLTNPSVESSFISSAINQAISDHADGLNVDFEPYGFSSGGIPYLANQYAAFLTNFVSIAHAHGLYMSVDMACWDGPYVNGGPTCSGGAFWNFKLESQSKVDLILTMQTYDTSLANFQNILHETLNYVPRSQLAAGFLTESQNDASLSQEFAYLESNTIQTVMIWPSNADPLPSVYWSSTTSYLQGA